MKLFKALLVVFLLSITPFTIHAAEVDINQATAEMLSKSLKGIGIKKAQAIVLYRKKHGPFKKASDLTNVKGIGDKTVAKNRKNIIIGKKKQAK